MATLEQTGYQGLSEVVVNHVDNEAPMRWLEKGYNDFKNNLTLSLLYGAFIAAIGLIMTFSVELSPSVILGSITGFVIVGPFVAIGLYDMSREMEFGREPKLHHALSALRNNTGTLLTFALALGFLHTVWTRLTGLLIGLFFQDLNISRGNLMEILSEPQTILFLGIFLLIGAVIVSFTFAVTVISIPMIMHRNVDIVSAAITSIRVVKKNPRKMFTWAAMIGTLMLIGIATGFIGLIVVFPIVGHASWHAYRELVERPEHRIEENGPLVSE
ncbi:DUF2189 domain-containing protein [Leucothrix arctica]|uniref:DUF2189 domain-containing protein n=1 Tax=Leucothrix arctica TaxID=1481894 RepID=A0A317CR90_9GAMM|nr:DUF2189 domain-containing protein [Leucothrix arctica]PWQ98940.1 hypothetical protein DKT75_01905 [Leucothrix arctica]